MAKKKRPVDMTPDVHEFNSPPDSVHNLINRYGTYEVQSTADTENEFPMIAPGLPRAWREMRLDKYDLEREQ